MMTKRLFGTDGIRGKANVYPITADIALKVGRTTAKLLAEFTGKAEPRIIVGKDTRLSCYYLEQAIAAGICSAGADAILTGPLPTPGIAFLVRNMRCDAGVVISASHNPYDDNGIKIFDRNGFKLPDAMEDEIQKHLDDEDGLPTGKKIGRASRIDDVSGRYIVHLKKNFPEDCTLDGLRIALDASNGAAYKVAPTIFKELGAEVISIGVNPNGTNINDQVGATYPQAVQKLVLENKADIGISLDGDADRLQLVTHKGDLVNGDQILGLLAKVRRPSHLVGTIMTNKGLEVFLEKQGIALVRAQVGDRYISEVMREKNYFLGGEPSGHVIVSPESTTGDGLLTSLLVLGQMVKTGKSLKELTEEIELYPQVLKAVRVKTRKQLKGWTEYENLFKSWESKFGQEGYLVIRYSGTEPVLRIMVESPNEKLQKACVEDFISFFEKNLKD